MANLYLPVPVYYVKILTIADAVPTGTYGNATVTMIEPLPVANVEFTQGIYVQGQKQLGSFTIQLLDVRDIENRYLLAYYNLLDYEQRVEIYDNQDMLGDPVFTGVITKLPQSFEKWQFSGDGVLRRLEERRLRHYQVFNSTAPNGFSQTVAQIITQLTSTYQVVLKDDFNIANTSSGTIDANWSATSGVQVQSNQVLMSAGAGAFSQMTTVTSYAPAVTDFCKVSFDWNASMVSNLFGGSVAHYLNFQQQSGVGIGYQCQIQQAPNTDGITDSLITVTNSGGATIGTRRVTQLFGQWNHFDYYSWRLGSNRQLVFVINNVEMINIVDTGAAGITGAFSIMTQNNMVSGTFTTYIDNFVAFQSTAQLTVGTVGSPTVTPSDFQFNGDTNLEALDKLMDLESWEYTITPKAGKGNDVITVGTAVGTDRSGSLRYAEDYVVPTTATPVGQTVITNLQRDRSNNQLATSLNTYGLVQDDTSANFTSMNLAQFGTYGPIDMDYPDPRVVDTDTARTLSQWRLQQTAFGSVSLSGDIYDESLPSSQIVAGDYVWLTAPTFDIDKKVRIVQLTRKSGTRLVNVIFDYLPYRLDYQFGQLLTKLAQEYRSFDNRMNTQSFHLTYGAGGGSVNLYPYIRGNQLTKAFIRVSTPNGGTTVSISIDGNNITSVPRTPPYTLTDQTYLVQAGEHTMAVGSSAASTFDVLITTQSLA